MLNTDKSSYELQFYSLNIDLFKSIIQEIKQNNIKINNRTNNGIKFTAEGDNALLTIPYDSSWKIFINGKTVISQKGAKGLLVIPLFEGVNNIEMTYTVKGKNLGLICTVLSILLFTLYCVVDKKYFSKN